MQRLPTAVGLLSVDQKGTNRTCRWLQDESDDDEGKDKIGSLFQKAKAIGAQQGTADDLPSSGFAGQGRTLGGSSAQVRLRTLLLLLLWQKLLRRQVGAFARAPKLQRKGMQAPRAHQEFGCCGTLLHVEEAAWLHSLHCNASCMLPACLFASHCTVLQAAAAGGGQRNHVVKFYRNNVFTVDDGPARHMDDPANQDFISSVSKGECPSELDPGDSSTPVTVNLLRAEEDYVAPK